MLACTPKQYKCVIYLYPVTFYPSKLEFFPEFLGVGESCEMRFNDFYAHVCYSLWASYIMLYNLVDQGRQRKGAELNLQIKYTNTQNKISDNIQIYKYTRHNLHILTDMYFKFGSSNPNGICLWRMELMYIYCLFVCVEVLRPSQPNGVSLPNHTFTGQA